MYSRPTRGLSQETQRRRLRAGWIGLRNRSARNAGVGTDITETRRGMAAEEPFAPAAEIVHARYENHQRHAGTQPPPRETAGERRFRPYRRGACRGNSWHGNGG